MHKWIMKLAGIRQHPEKGDAREEVGTRETARQIQPWHPPVLIIAAALAWPAAASPVQAAPPGRADVPITVPNKPGAGVWALSVTAPTGQKNILMASMHVADRHLRQPDRRVIRQARVVVYEHPGFGDGTVPATPWRNALAPADIEALREHFTCKLPYRDDKLVDNVIRWHLAQPTPVAAEQLAADGCDSVGYESRDTIIQLAQQRYGITPKYLETDKEVVAQEKRVPWDTSGRGIHFALSNDAAILRADVVDALNDGDYAKVDRTVRNSLAATGMDYATFYNPMVRERNAAWMQTLPPLLDTGGAFVLVGAEHLPGRDGLIRLLRQRGYIVQPVQLPSGAGTTAEAYGPDPD
ncbi:TraB/GumN family protein [Paraburkholderia ginsengisoli]|uniref:TraB/GumN family protein n=1 Tax=Paraburkholderia ginsengisoli TaxID=311231 RepID=A0A7T4TCU4_9BURK|nr:TraB/GumN family protein [Paraburkholderia ginsengisoli]QQC67895.1 TraB/GumN family protein [Paraburkholderia ginsengisoli]